MRTYTNQMIVMNGSLVNTSIRIVCGDPARSHDAFGIVGIESDIIHDIVRIKMAKQFFNEPYGTVANYLKKIQYNIKPDFMGIETNYRGDKLLKLFNYKYKLKMKGIYTSSNLTEQTRAKGFTMDKSYMIKWFIQHKTHHKILFPEILTPEMTILKNQIESITRYPTLTGYTYKAQKGRHDDLFMSLLLCCHIHNHYHMQRVNNIEN